MQRLEAGVALLRVVVDAKNDTLVLIRGRVSALRRKDIVVDSSSSRR